MRFEYGDSRVPFKMEKGGVAYYLTYDQVGSLRAVSDTSGTVVKRIDYDSFGNIITDTDTSFEVPFGFAGGLHDRDTGLVRFGFRDYDPQVGRWTAKDPIGFGGGSWNLYSYSLNNPINFVDSFGLAADSACPDGFGWNDAWQIINDNFWDTVYNLPESLLDEFWGNLQDINNAFGPNNPEGAILLVLFTEAMNPQLYWQYYPKGNLSYQSRWVVKGSATRPPYPTGQAARDALNLPPHNPGTCVRKVPTPRNIAGPRTPKPRPEWGYNNPGTGEEYFMGSAFPD